MCSSELLGEFDGHRKRFRIFRIRRDYRREVTALDHLFGHAVYILKAPFFQRSGNKHSTRTMKRRINDTEVFLTFNHFRVDGKGVDFIQIYLVDVFADNLNQILVALELDVLNSYFVHFIDNGSVVRSKYLRTVIPIGFVTVVFFRGVACGQVDTALATEVTDGERNFRSRTQVIEQINLDTVRRENISRDFSELAAVVTAVMADDNFDLVQIGKFLFQIVG